MNISVDGQVFSQKHTASFFVDAQKGFTPLCPEELPVPEGDKIVEELNALLAFSSYKLASGDEHPQDALYFSDADHPPLSPAPEGPNMDIRWPPHCIAGTKGSELLDELPAKEDYDLYIAKGVSVDKHPYGGCYHDFKGTESTGAIEFLKEHDIKLVLVGGLATEYCVKETVLQLLDNGFEVILNLSACRGLDSEACELAIRDMSCQGAIIIEDSSAIKELADA